MPHLTPKRLVACLLTTLLVLSLVFVAAASIGAGNHTASAHSTVASTDVEDNDLPHGSYNNHLIHLHPSSQTFAATINFNVTGGGLPTGATLTFFSDLDGRCTSNTVDGSTVVVTGDGSFPPQIFSADNCKVGNYLIEAIDTLGRVYDAILTVSS